MTRSETINTIAKDTLGIDTLETRMSDSLDFHDVAVWMVKDALEKAYNAGRSSASRLPPRAGNLSCKSREDI